MTNPEQDVELVTTKQVRDWAEANGLVAVAAPGGLKRVVIDAYEEAHPNHMHSRYAHGPGGYDKGCRCDECKTAKGIDPNYCPACTRHKVSLTNAKDEVSRLARAMARSRRNEERLRPELLRAKESLSRTRSVIAQHEAEHGAGAA